MKKLFRRFKAVEPLSSSPRWTTYDAVFYGLDLPEGVPASQQERAYTSPIWYTP